MRRAIVISFLIIFIYSLGLAANDEKSYVENLIKSKTDQILSVIRQKNISEKDKKKKIFEIAKPLFDFDTMAKLTLGRKYWPKLTPEQRKRFTELFIKRLKMTYLDRVTIYGNETIEFKPAIQKGRIKIYVPSVVTSKGDRISVLYKFWKSKKGWKIYDVEVEGVSIIRTYRSQFNEILKKGSIDDLFKELEKLTQTSNK